MKAAIAAAAVAIAAGGSALAQGYPAKPIRMIVPYAAGGGSDIRARLIAQKLSETMGKPVVVENRVGAGGNIGTDAVAKAAPDGYTLGIATPGPVTMGRKLYPHLPYEPEKDLAPVILVNESPIVLVVHPSIPARNVKELIALSKNRGTTLNAALPSTGSVQHLLTEMLRLSAGMRLETIPYKGAEPAANDVLGGHVDFMWSVVTTVLPFIEAGKLRPLAVASDKRSPVLAKVPTSAEAGIPQIIGTNWNGVIAPGGTPRELLQRLNREIQRGLEMPDVRERYAALDLKAIGGSPDDFRTFLKAETERWATVIRKAGIKVE